MSQWRARQIQLVWFTQARSTAPAAELFRAATGGVSPTSTFSNQMPQGGPVIFPGQSLTVDNAQGSFGKYTLAVSSQPQRVDVFLQPLPVDTQPGMPPLFSDLIKVHQDCEAIRESVSRSVSLATRIALVSNYVIEAVDLTDANTKVLNTIGLDAAYLRDGSDIVFSANRRKVLGSFNVNRLLRWQVEMFSSMSFSVGEHGALLPQPTSPLYAASMVLDLNTVPASEYLLKDEAQAEAFSHLFSEEQRLAEIGSPAALRSQE